MDPLASKNQNSRFVVLADIKDSRSIEDRVLLQSSLKRLTRSVNSTLESCLEVPFSISGGDEIQGLLADSLALYRVIDTIDLGLESCRFRFGVGWGEVATEPAPRTTEMDGACFHHARKAIQRGKQDDRWVTVLGVGEDADRILNGVFLLIQTIREGWTDRQRQAVTVRKSRPNQTLTAEALGLDASTLSKMLKAASYKRLREMERSMSTLVGMWVPDRSSDRGNPE